MTSLIEYKKMIAERDLQSVWPQWNIVRLLGEGSFGEVYEIQRNEYGRVSKCALKILRRDNRSYNQGNAYVNISHSNTSEEFINTVLKEIDIMEKLKGAPNIVAIEDYEVVRNPDSCAVLIRMELLRNLGDFITARQQITITDIIRIGTDICNALEFCEGQNIIHRDVKESNIFYSDMGMFKLGDFGISRQLSDYLLNSATMTSAGTISKMAPEVYNRERYDNRVDIYSLGIVLYSLLNYGRPPFYPMYPQEVSAEAAYAADMKRIKGAAIPPLPGVDEQLNRIICKACHPKPSGRYRTASEFREELLNYYESISTMGFSSNGNGYEPTRSFPVAAGVAIIMAIVVAVGGTVVMYGRNGGNKKPNNPIAYQQAYQDEEDEKPEETPTAQTAQKEDKKDTQTTEADEKGNDEEEDDETDDEADDSYSGGASGLSLRRMTDYYSPSGDDGTAEAVDDNTISIKNEDGEIVAYVENPGWATETRTESGDIYYIDPAGKMLIVGFTSSVSSTTYISMLMDHFSSEKYNEGNYEILEESSSEVDGRTIEWVKMKYVEDGDYGVYYWGAVSCNGGCLSLASVRLSRDEGIDMSLNEFLDDVSCITISE